MNKIDYCVIDEYTVREIERNFFFLNYCFL